MTNTYHGACLCGDTGFELEGDIEKFYLCHCEHCQKDTGSSHSANLFFSNGKLKWLSGRNNVKTFTLPETKHVKSFCLACGSALPSEQIDGKVIVVPAGCLNSPIDVKPDAHLFVSSKADWDNGLENVPEIEKLPE